MTLKEAFRQKKRSLVKIFKTLRFKIFPFRKISKYPLTV
jgi:hypothetical protein